MTKDQPPPDPVSGETVEDDLGLSIDMLDVDRLREWARLLLVHGADISHWASTTHVARKMQLIATGIEKAVRDIGKLRDLLASAHQRAEQAERENEGVRQQLPNGDWKGGASLARCVEDLRMDRDALARELATVREAIGVIHTAVRGDHKSECWTIRKWLDERGVFNDDIQSAERLVEAVCVFVAPPPARAQEGQ